MGLFARIPQLWRYIGVAVFSLLISLLFVALAVRIRCPSIAGIGGAFGTAAAFASLFVRPDYGLRLYKVIKQGISPGLSEIQQLKEQMAALEEALRINSNGQVIQNFFIALASIIGTLFWALGEYLANWLIYWHFSC